MMRRGSGSIDPSHSTHSPSVSAPVESHPEREPWSATRRARVLDSVELGVVLVLWALFVQRHIAALLDATEVLLGTIIGLLLLAEGAVVVLLITRRRAKALSLRFDEWIVALGATGLPLLVYPPADAFQPLVPAAVCAAMLLFGTAFSVWAKLTLGRSLGCVPANRGIVQAGPYAMVRHPMYAGYLAVHVAFLLANPSASILLIYGTCWGLQVPRLLAEERLLRQDPAYSLYAERVRYRLIPGVW